MKPKCLSCQFYTCWEQASGGSIARCNHRPEVEEMIRTEMRLWSVSGNWAASYEADEFPSVLSEEVVEPEYVCEEPDRDMQAAVQEWLDNRLVRLDAARPVYRSVGSIEEDILWKFTACRDYVEMDEEEAWDDPLLQSHYSYPEFTVPEPGEAPLSPTLINEIELIPVTVESRIAVPTGCP